MKFIKKTVFALLIVTLLVVISGYIIQYIENKDAYYLKINNYPQLQNDTYTIVNVNIVPMIDDTIYRNATVIVEDGVIKSINQDNSMTEGEIIDAHAGYLTPGLIDMHIHLWDRQELGLYLANGVTTVRSLLGMPFHLKVKEEIANGQLIGPLFFTASPQFSGSEEADPLKKPVDSPEEARKLIRKYKADGYDYIKTYNTLPKDIFDVVLEESKEAQIPVISHPSFKVNYNYNFSSDISTVEHTEDIYQQPLNYSVDYEKLKPVIDGYAQSGQSHSPTLTVFYNLTEIYNKGEDVLKSDHNSYINPFINLASNDYSIHTEIRQKDSTSIKRINRQHEFHLEIVGMLNKAGVNIVCGTDAGIVYTAPGFSVHQELEFYKQAGMSNYEALKTATINPTKVYEEYKDFGTIEEGKKANLILSKKNPLEDINGLKNPKWVMIEGRLISTERIAEFKEKAKNRKNLLATAIRVGKYILWEK